MLVKVGNCRESGLAVLTFGLALVNRDVFCKGILGREPLKALLTLKCRVSTLDWIRVPIAWARVMLTIKPIKKFNICCYISKRKNKEAQWSIYIFLTWVKSLLVMSRCDASSHACSSWKCWKMCCHSTDSLSSLDGTVDGWPGQLCCCKYFGKLGRHVTPPLPPVGAGSSSSSLKSHI